LNPVNGPKVEFSYVDELKLTLKNGFTAEEFASSKKAYLENRIGQRAQDNGLLNQIANHELQGRTMKWDGDLEAKIQALTLDQVNAAFRKHIDASQVSIVKAGDFKAAGVYK
jgi:zinc protease